MKKYELTNDFIINAFGKKLFRIKALIDIEKYGVKAGALGGYIEKEGNLSQEGNAWVCGNAEVYGDADYLYIHGLGTCHRTTTVFKCKDELIRIKCGYFYGTIEEFKKQVVNTRDGKVRTEYLKFAELIKIYFGLE